jgi:hypothetical protein
MVGTGSTNFPIWQIDTLNTSGVSTNVVLPGSPFASAASQSGGGPVIAGVTVGITPVAYVIDTGAAYNVSKIKFDGTNWVMVGTAVALPAGSVCGLAAYYDGANVKIYYNTAANLYQLTDTGADTAFTITETLPGTLIGTAGTNNVFKGIAMAPSAGTLADVIDFTVGIKGSTVNVGWTTATEADCMGYNVYRATSLNGKFTKVNAALIPALGDPFNGHAYSFNSLIAPGQTLYFKVEDVNHKGVGTMHEALKATTVKAATRPGVLATLTAE